MVKWEDLVNFPADNETSSKIRKYFGLERALSEAENKGITREIVVQVHGMLNSEYFRRGDPSHKGRLFVLREIKKRGWPLENYSHLSPNELRIYIDRLNSEVSNYKKAFDEIR